MSKKPLPSPELLRKILRYEYTTGLLFWRKRPVEMFNDTVNRSAQHACNNWNAKFAGKEALITDNGHGYKCGRIFNKHHQAHRVIWAIVTGFWPVDQIDHEDHDRANNRWVNLFEASNAENGKNASMKSNNTSGFTGVWWRKDTERWAAEIFVDGKKDRLGDFEKKSDAIAARKAANQKYNFHENHGLSS